MTQPKPQTQPQPKPQPPHPHPQTPSNIPTPSAAIPSSASSSSSSYSTLASPARHEVDRYLLELLETTARQIEHATRRLDREVAEEKETLTKILHELRAILHVLQPPTPAARTASITNQFSGDTLMANNTLIFNVGQTSIDTITPLLEDGVTPSGGVLSNVSVAFSDPSATAVVNPDNTITFTGVAASAGAISGATTATLTDTDGAVFTFTQAFTVTTLAVTPPPPAQLTKSIANVFSTPTP
jgi:hypothetical protein